jgi:putative membrane protein
MGSIVREIGYSTRRWWAAGAYLVWAGALLWLLLTGRYQAFLRPGFWALLLWAFAVLLLFAAALFWARPSLPAGSMPAVPGIRLLVMLLPLIYVMAAQEQTLGSHALKNRLSEPAYMERFARGSPAIVEGDNPLVTLLDILQNFKVYEGRKITTQGMVQRDETVPPGHILVFRFLIVCCAADALPAGALVSHEEVDSFEQDTWVSVEGVLGLKKVGDLTFPLIQAERITKIDPPKDPYLFPRLF